MARAMSQENVELVRPDSLREVLYSAVGVVGPETHGGGEPMTTIALPVAALGLGWIGLVIVILVIIFLITRVF
jgi:hypothetical protein